MFPSFLSLVKSRFLLPIFIILLLGGCGKSFSIPKALSTPTTFHSGNTPSPAHQSSLVGTSVAFDLDGLIHIQSASGFACTHGNPSEPPGLLVLPTIRQTYDQGTLQPTENYVSNLLSNTGDYEAATGHRDTVPYPVFSANPDDFRLLAVTSVDNSCSEIIHITNVSSEPVQITPAFVQLTADSQINNQHYNLIEGCSFLSLIPGCAGSVGGNESDYFARFALHSGKAQTRFSCICSVNELTLQPGEVAKVILSYFTSPSNNLSFSLMPSFTLGRPGEKQITYSIPQLQETFAFASTSQFSCYSLQGQKFAEIAMRGNVWCI